MDLQELRLLSDTGLRVISIQTQLLERANTLAWITIKFANPLSLPVFLWNLGQTKFKQVQVNDSLECLIQSTELSEALKLRSEDGFEVLDFIQDFPNSGIFVVENLQSLMVTNTLTDGFDSLSAYKLIASLVNIFYDFQVSNIPKFLLLLGTDEVDLPERLRALIPQVRNPLPKMSEISSIISNFLPTIGYHSEDIDKDSLVATASGLTKEEILVGLRLGANRSQGMVQSLNISLLNYKVERLRGYGLDFIGQPNVPNLGGLDLLKEALLGVKADYSPKAREANIPLPKGWLLVGPPGTGKTLSAKVCAKALGFPLISVDVAAIASIGAAYLRRLIERVEACAPAVVYFDEFDKLFIADSSTGEDASSRALLGLLLTWLQEKQSTTFVIATLNRLKALPPELTRVGRFDEIFYVGFPQAIERKQIISLHAAKFDSRYQKEDSPLTESEWKILLGKTVNCTGAELQKIVELAARKLFHQGKPVLLGLNELLEQREAITPLYVRDPDRVIAIENEARFVSRPSSTEDRSVYAPPLRSFWGETVAER